MATLDLFSSGRVTLGVAVGTPEEENRALGSDYSTRRAYANEAIQVLRELWTADDPEFTGRFFKFWRGEVLAEAVATGGCTDPGRRRKPGDAGALCAVGRRLHPIGGSVAALKAQIETLSERWAEHGRAAAEMRVVARSELDLVDSGSADPSTPMVGSLEQVIEAVAAYAEIGVSELVLSISTDDVAHIHRRSDLRNGCCRGSPLDRRSSARRWPALLVVRPHSQKHADVNRDKSSILRLCREGADWRNSTVVSKLWPCVENPPVQVIRREDRD